MPGYIYLIMMADGVYKVGRTAQDYGTTLKRLRAYPSDSVIVMVQKVYDDVVVEKEVLRRCREKFGPHLRGREYFIGSETEIINIIHECMNFQNQNPTPNHVKTEQSSAEIYLMSKNLIIRHDLFAPLLVIEEEFEIYCSQHKIVPVNFREYCPLPIVRHEGPLEWKPNYEGAWMALESPEVVQGASLHFYCPKKNSPMRPFAFGFIRRLPHLEKMPAT